MNALPSALCVPPARSLRGLYCGGSIPPSASVLSRNPGLGVGAGTRRVGGPLGAASPLNYSSIELDSESTFPSKHPPGAQSSKSKAGVKLGHNIIWAPPGKLRQRAAGRQQGGAARRPAVSAPSSNTAEKGANPTSPKSRTPLTGLLKKAWSVGQLVAALQHRPTSEFNHLNVSFALNKLAKLCKRGAGSASELQLAFALLERPLLQQAHTYPARSLSTAFHALAKLRRPNPDLFSVAQQRAMQLGRDFTPQGLSNLLWAFSYSGIEAPALFEAMTPHLIRLAPSFSAAELSNVLWAFTVAGSSGSQAGAVFVAMQPHVTTHAARLSPHQLATVAWAYASLPHPSPGLYLNQLFPTLEAAVVRKEAQFTPHALVRVVRSFAATGQPAPELLALAEQRVLHRPTNFSAQELSALARSYGTLGQQAPALFFTLGQEALLRRESFRTRELASVVRAAANLGHRVPDLLTAVRQRALGAPAQLSSQEAAMVGRSFAVLREPGEGLYEVLEGEVVARGVGGFRPQELANLAHAFALAGYRVSEGFHDALRASLAVRGREYKPQELVNIAWAASSLISEPSFEATEGLPPAAAATLAAVEEEFLRDPSRFNAQDLAQLAWAASKRGSARQSVLDAVAAQAADQAGAFSAQGLANLLWAVASLGSPSPHLFGAMEAAVVRAAQSEKFSAQGLALTLRAYASAGALRRSSDLAHALEAATLAAAPHFTPQGIKYVLRALSTVGPLDPRVLTALGAPLAAHTDELSLSEAVYLLGAYLRAGAGGDVLLGALQERVRVLSEGAGAEGVTASVVSLVTQAGPFASEALRPLGDAVVECAAEMSGAQVVAVLGAFQEGGCVHGGLLGALETRLSVVGEEDGELSAEEVTRAAQAFAVLGHCSVGLGAALERKLLRAAPDLTPEQAEAVSRALAMHSGTIPADVLALATP